VLNGLQEQLVRQQLADHLASRRPCPHYHRPRTLKGYHPLRFRSAFGDIELRSPRWYWCACEQRPVSATYSALNTILTTHTAPELEFLQAKWAAHLSFTAVVDLLHDVLPVDPGLHKETVRTHVFATAERLEAQLGPEQFAYDAGCQYEIEASPEPGPPVTVGLDGGYIRGRERRPGGTGCFEVIAGKSIPEEGKAKVFAGVSRIDTKPKRRGALAEERDAGRPSPILLKKLHRTLEEFGTYIDNNASGIVNYGERYRCGERISTGFVESTINQVIAKRFVKQQQMRWTPRGAHLLLQIRVQTLNDDLHATFQRWYPDLKRNCEEKVAA
jgi:hypothetical protein